MKKLFTSGLTLVLLCSITLAQTPQEPQQAPQEIAPDDVVRISTQLVQTDVVVTDKNDQIIPDLTLNDFKITENGKRQELRFVQFVSADASPRLDGSLTVAGRPVDPEVARNLSAKDLRRVFAFVVDDLTIPFEDVSTVRQMLTNFIDHQMREGDLVAIIRVVGGGGLLQQFTSDKRILRSAINRISPELHTFSAFNNLTPAGEINRQMLQAAEDMNVTAFPAEAISNANSNLDNSEEGITRGFRALTTLQVAGDVTTSMKTLPGRKSLVLISGGLPMVESSPSQVSVGGAPVPIMETRAYVGNVTYLLRLLVDNAGRAGVVINTMDIRGLKASRGVSRFTDPGNEASSHISLGANSSGQGRLPNMGTFDNLSLDTMSGHQGLQALADSTGGVSVVNVGNFAEALDKILARSSYYILAYTPSEPFDNKYHKLKIEVNRPGAKAYGREGYFATPDSARGPLSREDAIVKAAMSPLAKREIEVASRLQYRFLPDTNVAEADINLLINANNMNFREDADGRYKSTFDVVGFLMNSRGKPDGGFSQTVTTNLSSADYKRALALGLSYSAHAQLIPGTYQLRAVVRETDTGRLGSMSQFLEVPDLSKKNLTASSIFLYAVDPANNTPQPLTALRQLPRQQDLRYAAVIYFPKLSDGKAQLTSQVIVSQGDKVIFQEAEQPITGPVQNSQMLKIGQLGLGKARPGRYVLTLLIKEPGKKAKAIIRSVDFNLVD